MLEQIRALARKHALLSEELADPSVYGNPEKLKKLNQELRELAPAAEVCRAYEQAERDRAAAEALLADPEMGELAAEELSEARAAMERLEEDMRRLLLPRDPNDRRSVVMELRAGVGGEEGALFAAALLRMYGMYAAARGWRVDLVSQNLTELGGVKECSLLIEGEDVFSRLKFESGVHRVQRVPETESGGRIHTSAATVAVLPEAEDVEFAIDPKDLQIDTYRSSGAGGQHVNKTESAIRITHLPTGTVVECQDERSQYKNKEKAMRVLRSRLYEAERVRQAAATAAERRSQVGSGDRSERIRTYNFPQGRCTDHRINLTLYSLDRIMEGEVEPLFEALATAAQTEALKAEAEA
ncbi:peptide chain release factor 1 [Dysosmobacter sp.]|uniref:peptide chain release factor 1 n=1 Tax=Dysosmobacter sp. TaxID=2591382 RepID=UPI002A8B7418|nr:peptide chain release factor 1 [Dysosmobacter sp.]MDY3281508.1 peptide chain release factor 1 [Dysosmobacter sp.]